jgi:hypothetical protein
MLHFKENLRPPNNVEKEIDNKSDNNNAKFAKWKRIWGIKQES